MLVDASTLDSDRVTGAIWDFMRMYRYILKTELTMYLIGCWYVVSLKLLKILR